MTLGETELTYNDTCGVYIGDEAEMEAGCALRDVLLRAKKESRLTCGVYQAAKKLDVEPETVMLCIHADLCIDDVAHDLHFPLMEAFCWENGIRLLKVGDVQSIKKVCEDVPPLSPCMPESPVDITDLSDPLPRSERARDFSCLLVEFPEKMDAACNKLLAHYAHLAEETPFPHITLAT